MPVLVSVFACLLLAACAAQGVPYAAHVSGNSPVPPGQSRLVVLRLDNSLEGMAPARLTLDGLPLPVLYEKGYVIHELVPGNHELVTSEDEASGQCQLPLEVASGETAYFLVAPRPESRKGWIPSFLPSWSQQTEALVDLFTALGPALESYGQSCRGTFSIAPIPASKAAQYLPGLRESRR